MKLRVDTGELYNRPATLADIREALKELGYVPVQIDQLIRCYNTGYWEDEIGDIAEEVEMDNLRGES